MAVFGCLLGSADIRRWVELYHELNAPGSWWFVGLAIGAGIIGGAIGLVAMFLSRSGWWMRLLALPAGILAGQIGLFMLLATGPIWRSLFAIGVMLVAALIFRLDAD